MKGFCLDAVLLCLALSLVATTLRADTTLGDVRPNALGSSNRPPLHAPNFRFTNGVLGNAPRLNLKCEEAKDWEAEPQSFFVRPEIRPSGKPENLKGELRDKAYASRRALIRDAEIVAQGLELLASFRDKTLACSDPKDETRSAHRTLGRFYDRYVRPQEKAEGFPTWEKVCAGDADDKTNAMLSIDAALSRELRESRERFRAANAEAIQKGEVSLPPVAEADFLYSIGGARFIDEFARSFYSSLLDANLVDDLAYSGLRDPQKLRQVLSLPYSARLRWLDWIEKSVAYAALRGDAKAVETRKNLYLFRNLLRSQKSTLDALVNLKEGQSLPPGLLRICFLANLLPTVLPKEEGDDQPLAKGFKNIVLSGPKAMSFDDAVVAMEHNLQQIEKGLQLLKRLEESQDPDRAKQYLNAFGSTSFSAFDTACRDVIPGNAPAMNAAEFKTLLRCQAKHYVQIYSRWDSKVFQDYLTSEVKKDPAALKLFHRIPKEVFLHAYFSSPRQNPFEEIAKLSVLSDTKGGDPAALEEIRRLVKVAKETPTHYSPDLKMARAVRLLRSNVFDEVPDSAWEIAALPATAKFSDKEAHDKLVETRDKQVAAVIEQNRLKLDDLLRFLRDPKVTRQALLDRLGAYYSSRHPGVDLERKFPLRSRGEAATLDEKWEFADALLKDFARIVDMAIDRRRVDDRNEMNPRFQNVLSVPATELSPEALYLADVGAGDTLVPRLRRGHLIKYGKQGFASDKSKGTWPDWGLDEDWDVGTPNFPQLEKFLKENFLVFRPSDATGARKWDGSAQARTWALTYFALNERNQPTKNRVLGHGATDASQAVAKMSQINNDSASSLTKDAGTWTSPMRQGASPLLPLPTDTAGKKQIVQQVLAHNSDRLEEAFKLLRDPATDLEDLQLWFGKYYEDRKQGEKLLNRGSSAKEGLDTNQIKALETFERFKLLLGNYYKHSGLVDRRSTERDRVVRRAKLELGQFLFKDVSDQVDAAKKAYSDDIQLPKFMKELFALKPSSAYASNARWAQRADGTWGWSTDDPYRWLQEIIPDPDRHQFIQSVVYGEWKDKTFSPPLKLTQEQLIEILTLDEKHFRLLNESLAVLRRANKDLYQRALARDSLRPHDIQDLHRLVVKMAPYGPETPDYPVRNEALFRRAAELVRSNRGLPLEFLFSAYDDYFKAKASEMGAQGAKLSDDFRRRGLLGQKGIYDFHTVDVNLDSNWMTRRLNVPAVSKTTIRQDTISAENKAQLLRFLVEDQIGLRDKWDAVATDRFVRNFKASEHISDDKAARLKTLPKNRLFDLADLSMALPEREFSKLLGELFENPNLDKAIADAVKKNEDRLLPPSGHERWTHERFKALLSDPSLRAQIDPGVLREYLKSRLVELDVKMADYAYTEQMATNPRIKRLASGLSKSSAEEYDRLLAFLHGSDVALAKSRTLANGFVVGNSPASVAGPRLVPGIDPNTLTAEEVAALTVKMGDAHKMSYGELLQLKRSLNHSAGQVEAKTIEAVLKVVQDELVDLGMKKDAVHMPGQPGPANKTVGKPLGEALEHAFDSWGTDWLLSPPILETWRAVKSNRKDAAAPKTILNKPILSSSEVKSDQQWKTLEDLRAHVSTKLKERLLPEKHAQIMKALDTKVFRPNDNRTLFVNSFDETLKELRSNRAAALAPGSPVGVMLPGMKECLAKATGPLETRVDRCRSEFNSMRKILDGLIVKYDGQFAKQKLTEESLLAYSEVIRRGPASEVGTRLQKMSDDELMDWSLYFYQNRFRNREAAKTPNELAVRNSVYGAVLTMAELEITRRMRERKFKYNNPPFNLALPPFGPENANFSWSSILFSRAATKDGSPGSGPFDRTLQQVLSGEAVPTGEEFLDLTAWFNWAETKKIGEIAGTTGKVRSPISEMSYAQQTLLHDHVSPLDLESRQSSIEGKDDARTKLDAELKRREAKYWGNFRNAGESLKKLDTLAKFADAELARRQTAPPGAPAEFKPLYDKTWPEIERDVKAMEPEKQAKFAKFMELPENEILRFKRLAATPHKPQFSAALEMLGPNERESFVTWLGEHGQNDPHGYYKALPTLDPKFSYNLSDRGVALLNKERNKTGLEPTVKLQQAYAALEFFRKARDANAMTLLSCPHQQSERLPLDSPARCWPADKYLEAFTVSDGRSKSELLDLNLTFGSLTPDELQQSRDYYLKKFTEYLKADPNDDIHRALMGLALAKVIKTLDYALIHRNADKDALPLTTAPTKLPEFYQMLVKEYVGNPNMQKYFGYGEGKLSSGNMLFNIRLPVEAMVKLGKLPPADIERLYHLTRHEVNPKDGVITPTGQTLSFEYRPKSERTIVTPMTKRVNLSKEVYDALPDKKDWLVLSERDGFFTVQRLYTAEYIQLPDGRDIDLKPSKPFKKEINLGFGKIKIDEDDLRMTDGRGRHLRIRIDEANAAQLGDYVLYKKPEGFHATGEDRSADTYLANLLYEASPDRIALVNRAGRPLPTKSQELERSLRSAGLSLPKPLSEAPKWTAEDKAVVRDWLDHKLTALVEDDGLNAAVAKQKTLLKDFTGVHNKVVALEDRPQLTPEEKKELEGLRKQHQAMATELGVLQHRIVNSKTRFTNPDLAKKVVELADLVDKDLVSDPANVTSEKEVDPMVRVKVLRALKDTAELPDSPSKDFRKEVLAQVRQYLKEKHGALLPNRAELDILSFNNIDLMLLSRLLGRAKHFDTTLDGKKVGLGVEDLHKDLKKMLLGITLEKLHFFSSVLDEDFVKILSNSGELQKLERAVVDGYRGDELDPDGKDALDRLIAMRTELEMATEMKDDLLKTGPNHLKQLTEGYFKKRADAIKKRVRDSTVDEMKTRAGQELAAEVLRKQQPNPFVELMRGMPPLRPVADVLHAQLTKPDITKLDELMDNMIEDPDILANARTKRDANPHLKEPYQMRGRIRSLIHPEFDDISRFLATTRRSFMASDPKTAGTYREFLKKAVQGMNAGPLKDTLTHLLSLSDQELTEKDIPGWLEDFGLKGGVLERTEKDISKPVDLIEYYVLYKADEVFQKKFKNPARDQYFKDLARKHLTDFVKTNQAGLNATASLLPESLDVKPTTEEYKARVKKAEEEQKKLTRTMTDLLAEQRALNLELQKYKALKASADLVKAGHEKMEEKRKENKAKKAAGEMVPDMPEPGDKQKESELISYDRALYQSDAYGKLIKEKTKRLEEAKKEFQAAATHLDLVRQQAFKGLLQDNSFEYDQATQKLDEQLKHWAQKFIETKGLCPKLSGKVEHKDKGQTVREPTYQTILSGGAPGLLYDSEEWRVAYEKLKESPDFQKLTPAEKDKKVAELMVPFQKKGWSSYFGYSTDCEKIVMPYVVEMLREQIMLIDRGKQLAKSMVVPHLSSIKPEDAVEKVMSIPGNQYALDQWLKEALDPQSGLGVNRAAATREFKSWIQKSFVEQKPKDEVLTKAVARIESTSFTGMDGRKHALGIKWNGTRLLWDEMNLVPLEPEEGKVLSDAEKKRYQAGKDQVRAALAEIKQFNPDSVDIDEKVWEQYRVYDTPPAMFAFNKHMAVKVEMDKMGKPVHDPATGRVKYRFVTLDAAKKRIEELMARYRELESQQAFFSDDFLASLRAYDLKIIHFPSNEDRNNALAKWINANTEMDKIVEEMMSFGNIPYKDKVERIGSLAINEDTPAVALGQEMRQASGARWMELWSTVGLEADEFDAWVQAEVLWSAVELATVGTARLVRAARAARAAAIEKELAAGKNLVGQYSKNFVTPSLSLGQSSALLAADVIHGFRSGIRLHKAGGTLNNLFVEYNLGFGTSIEEESEEAMKKHTPEEWAKFIAQGGRDQSDGHKLPKLIDLNNDGIDDRLQRQMSRPWYSSRLPSSMASEQQNLKATVRALPVFGGSKILGPTFSGLGVNSRVAHGLGFGSIGGTYTLIEALNQGYAVPTALEKGFVDFLHGTAYGYSHTSFAKTFATNVGVDTAMSLYHAAREAKDPDAPHTSFIEDWRKQVVSGAPMNAFFAWGNRNKAPAFRAANHANELANRMARIAALPKEMRDRELERLKRERDKAKADAKKPEPEKDGKEGKEEAKKEEVDPNKPIETFSDLVAVHTPEYVTAGLQQMRIRDLKILYDTATPEEQQQIAKMLRIPPRFIGQLFDDYMHKKFGRWEGGNMMYHEVSKYMNESLANYYTDRFKEARRKAQTGRPNPDPLLPNITVTNAKIFDEHFNPEQLVKDLQFIGGPAGAPSSAGARARAFVWGQGESFLDKIPNAEIFDHLDHNNPKHVVLMRRIAGLYGIVDGDAKNPDRVVMDRFMALVETMRAEAKKKNPVDPRMPTLPEIVSAFNQKHKAVAIAQRDRLLNLLKIAELGDPNEKVVIRMDTKLEDIDLSKLEHLRQIRSAILELNPAATEPEIRAFISYLGRQAELKAKGATGTPYRMKDAVSSFVESIESGRLNFMRPTLFTTYHGLLMSDKGKTEEGEVNDPQFQHDQRFAIFHSLTLEDLATLHSRAVRRAEHDYVVEDLAAAYGLSPTLLKARVAELRADPTKIPEGVTTLGELAQWHASRADQFAKGHLTWDQIANDPLVIKSVSIGKLPHGFFDTANGKALLQELIKRHGGGRALLKADEQAIRKNIADLQALGVQDLYGGRTSDSVSVDRVVWRYYKRLDGSKDPEGTVEFEYRD